MEQVSRREVLRRIGRGAIGLMGGMGVLAEDSIRAEDVKLNFVFVLMDDMGWKDLGCCGSTFYETPNIDRLAAQGMRFTSAYAACPVCSPTRASILTGKYPARLHLTDWIPGHKLPNTRLRAAEFHHELPLSETTIAEALRESGYATGYVGKWHLGKEGFYPDKQGFDINIGGTNQGSPPSYFYPYKNPTIPGGAEGEYLTDRLTDEAVTYIERNKDRPFFLYLAHYAVHTPITAKEDLIAKYQARLKPGDKHNPTYAAMIESVDEGIRRIVRKLEELGIADRTAVIFTSDNGGLARVTPNDPLRAGKGTLYEGGIRVPLIVRRPGKTPRGSTCDVPVMSTDFYPTILEMAGIRHDNKSPDGVSLVRLLKQTGDIKRDAMYWHYPHYHPGGASPSGSVRFGDYKLIEIFEDGRLELYNLKEDTGEEADLAEKMPRKAKELHRMLLDWRESVDASMPTPNPDFDPAKSS